MGRKINEVTGETKYYIPVDGKYYETSEKVYKIYFKMVNREQYQEKQKLKFESSYEELIEQGFSVEQKSSINEISAEDKAIATIMIEKMLNKLSLLNDYERWLIKEIYTHGKSDREIEKESAIPRRTVAYHKNKILAKLRSELEG